MREVIQEYGEAIFDTDRARALRVVHEALARGIRPEAIVFEVVVPAIHELVDRSGPRGDACLAQHFMAAQIAAEVTEAMVPRFERAPVALGTVVLGTSAGDFHGLGKRIVAGCLRALMIEVVDLGFSVPAERFVDEAVGRGAQVIAISSMMVHTARGAGGALRVRQLLRERGLEGRVRVAVGGAPYRFDPDLWRAVEADGWAETGLAAGKLVAGMIREVRAS